MPPSPTRSSCRRFAIDEEDTGYPNSYLSSKVSTFDMSVKGIAKKMKKYGVPVDGKGKAVAYGKRSLDNFEILTRLDEGVDRRAAGRATWATRRVRASPASTQPITPLTNDYALLKKQVDALVANGNTNIMEGVAWGMRVLSPGEPFAQGQDIKKTGVQKMMIVLTDGSNTFGNNGTRARLDLQQLRLPRRRARSGISSGGSAAATAKMNERTLAACTSAKAARHGGLHDPAGRAERRDRHHAQGMRIQPGELFRRAVALAARRGVFDHPRQDRADPHVVVRPGVGRAQRSASAGSPLRARIRLTKRRNR